MKKSRLILNLSSIFYGKQTANCMSTHLSIVLLKFARRGGGGAHTTLQPELSNFDQKLSFQFLLYEADIRIILFANVGLFRLQMKTTNLCNNVLIQFNQITQIQKAKTPTNFRTISHKNGHCDLLRNSAMHRCEAKL